ncbi:DUF6932 family protein [Kitasatospora sp. NPDC059599]|uniref:DUF6932 family protein n=1 Tax=Kitasatospora sp. NPDC059599 TaxID=3346880 RepID=UPI003688D3D5
MIPPLNSDHGYLPVGRYGATQSEIQSRFVDHEDFRGNVLRRDLWNEWQNHLILMEAALGTMPRVWLAGSFVSATVEPADVDVFYGVPPTCWDRLSSDDLEDLNNLWTAGWCRSHSMRVDAYGTRLVSEVHFDDLTPGRMGDDNLRAIQSLGLYDEIWHRTRLGSSVRRGYLEVQL